MYLASWAVLIQFMMCLLMPVFTGKKFTPDTLDGSQKTTDEDINAMPGGKAGAIAVTVVRYVARAPRRRCRGNHGRHHHDSGDRQRPRLDSGDYGRYASGGPCPPAAGRERHPRCEVDDEGRREDGWRRRGHGQRRGRHRHWNGLGRREGRDWVLSENRRRERLPMGSLRRTAIGAR